MKKLYFLKSLAIVIAIIGLAIVIGFIVLKTN